MIELAQKINEVGTLRVETQKNVTFRSRAIKNILVSDGDVCTIDIVKISEDGDVLETITLPYSLFAETVELEVWKLIDTVKESEVE